MNGLKPLDEFNKEARKRYEHANGNIDGALYNADDVRKLLHENQLLKEHISLLTEKP